MFPKLTEAQSNQSRSYVSRDWRISISFWVSTDIHRSPAIF